MWSLKLFHYFIKLLSFSLLWFHVKNTSSIYLKQTNSRNFCVWRTSVANLVFKNPRIRWCKFCLVSEIRQNNFCPNSMQLLLRINSAICTSFLVGVFLFYLQSIASLRASSPALCGTIQCKAYHICCHQDRILRIFSHILNPSLQ